MHVEAPIASILMKKHQIKSSTQKGMQDFDMV